MSTLREILMQLPRAYSERAIRNAEKQGRELSQDAGELMDLGDVLQIAFEWKNSIERFPFWDAVSDYTVGIRDTLPPIPKEGRTQEGAEYIKTSFQEAFAELMKREDAPDTYLYAFAWEYNEGNGFEPLYGTKSDTINQAYAIGYALSNMNAKKIHIKLYEVMKAVGKVSKPKGGQDGE